MHLAPKPKDLSKFGFIDMDKREGGSQSISYHGTGQSIVVAILLQLGIKGHPYRWLNGLV